MASTELQRPGEMLSREYTRLGTLQTIYDEEQAQRHARGQAAVAPAIDPPTLDDDQTALGCSR